MSATTQSMTNVTVTYRCDICGGTQDVVFPVNQNTNAWRLKQEHAWQIVTYENPFAATVTECRCPKCHLTPGSEGSK